MRISKPSGNAKIDKRTIVKNAEGEMINLADFKLGEMATFSDRFHFAFNKYAGGKAHLFWGVSNSDYLHRYSNGNSGKFKLTSHLYTNEELKAFVSEFGEGCFLTWYLEMTNSYTNAPILLVEKEFNSDLPRVIEGQEGVFLPLASVQLFLDEIGELDQYKTQVFRFFESSMPAEVFVRPWYWEYANFTAMNFGYASIPSGQVVRVLDNSDAPEPSKGWATYQLSYNKLVNKGFKLVSREPKETLKLSDFSAMACLTEDYKIFEDFDIKLKYLSSGRVGTEINKRRTYDKSFLRINTPTGDQFLDIGESTGSWDITSPIDKDVYFTCWAYLKPEWSGNLVYPALIENVGAINFQEITPTTRDSFNRVPIYQVKVRSIGGTGNVDLDTCVFVKHWRNSLSHIPTTDNKTVFLDSAGRLNVPALFCPIKEAYFLEDFDFEIIPKYDGINLKMIGGRRNIPVMTKNGVRWLGITEPNFSFTLTTPKIGAKQYWGIEWKFVADQNTLPNGHTLRTSGVYNDTMEQGNPNDCTGSTVLLLQVEAFVPKNNIPLAVEDFTVRKLWKNAPIKPVEMSNPDGLTVERIGSDNLLHVIDGLQPCPNNATISEDFNLRVEWSVVVKQIKFITDNNAYLNIPCKQGMTSKTMAVNGLNQSISSWGSLLFNSVYYGAYVSKMVTDGTRHVRMIQGLGKFPILNLAEDEVLIAMVRLEVPESFEAVDPKKLTLFRLWKKGLSAQVIPEVTGGLIPDQVTLFEATLSEQQKIFAPALCQTHGANFRILEDFDLTFSVGKTYTGDKTFLRVEPIGGLRNIPVMDNGIRRYMSIAQESIVMPDLFNTNFVGKWQYFVLMATISDTDGAITPLGTEYESDGSPWLVTPYANNTQFRFAQIGVKFNADGNTVDFQKNLKVFKYWKNALAPFSELWAEKVTP